ncbi:MAG TPA: Asp-tRNA(Asn)/Glu-tRNA(Gln) amidotransferase subunit GatB [Candidatus Saccharimonadales bacterium]|nr:Asp-tRNA(Asn)/Glu-tRNA(Gln) amidotransferase subunit GatB [Candidatus Saccharimonadales bacterium]
MPSYLLTVGMEVHVELETKTKIFCGCPNDPFESQPNSHVCPVCYGLPGALPLLNQEAVAMTVKLGRALKGVVAEETFWARKNYFYPDLPKGYQISQSTKPLVEKASVMIDGESHLINRIHLEEDAGKLIHSADGKSSLVNFNRAGVPLVEIVTEPDFHTPEAAKRFCQELQRIVRTLKISAADMEKGKMRCEANISVSTTDQLGVKVEVKNINSFRAVEKAIKYEYDRQIAALEAGGKIIQETRNWDDPKGKTVAMRTKETSADYRYFPEPDLPTVEIAEEIGGEIQLPEEKRAKLVEIGLPKELIHPIVDKNGFETVVKIAESSKEKAIEAGKTLVAIPEFLLLNEHDQIVFLALRGANGWSKETSAELIHKTITEKQKIEEVSKKFEHTTDLSSEVAEVIKEQAKAVADYKAGKEPLFNFLVGQVMAKTHGRANISAVREELTKQLG